MGKVKLVIELDTSDAYDQTVISLLRSSPGSARKELIVDSLLYFTRSPAYRLNDKIEQLLSAMGPGSAAAPAAPPVFRAVTVNPSVHDVRPAPQAAAPPSQAVSFTVPASSTDGSDDIFAGLAEKFS